MEFLPAQANTKVNKPNAMPAMHFGPKVPNLPSMKKHADFPIQPFKEEVNAGIGGQLGDIERHKLEV